MRCLVVLGAAALAVCLGPGSARAFSNFPSLVPNGNVNSCQTCHGASTSQFNAFGQDVRATLLNGSPNWPALYNLDSDGDGFKNGEELGDPCGLWRSGQTPAFTTNITKPGDPASKPTTHTTGTCGGASSSSSAVVSSSSLTPSSSSAAVSSSSLTPSSSSAVLSSSSSVAMSSSSLGTVDAGRADAGALDAGRADAGALDAGRADAGALDAGRADAGRADAGALDAGRADAGALDAGRTDAGRGDAGAADAGRRDAGASSSSSGNRCQRDGGYRYRDGGYRHRDDGEEEREREECRPFSSASSRGEHVRTDLPGRAATLNEGLNPGDAPDTQDAGRTPQGGCTGAVTPADGLGLAALLAGLARRRRQH